MIDSEGRESSDVPICKGSGNGGSRAELHSGSESSEVPICKGSGSGGGRTELHSGSESSGVLMCKGSGMMVVGQSYIVAVSQVTC